MPLDSPLLEGKGSFEGKFLRDYDFGGYMTAKKKPQDRAFGVQRSKERGDVRDILHLLFVGDTMQMQFYI